MKKTMLAVETTELQAIEGGLSVGSFDVQSVLSRVSLQVSETKLQNISGNTQVALGAFNSNTILGIQS